jgi:hypothetical protein
MLVIIRRKLSKLNTKAQANASTSVAGNSTDVSGERQNIGDGSGHIAYEICINP